MSALFVAECRRQLSYHLAMQTIYYMPGRGGRLNRGLGPALAARGYDVFGREITAQPAHRDDNAFANLSFEQQVQVVTHDLDTLVSEQNPCVIGNSFGAYLIVHALLQTKNFAGRCLLLSPVLGPCRLSGLYFRPPKAGQLGKAIERGAFQNMMIDIVTGSLDAHSPMPLCEQLAKTVQGELEIIEGQGHRIDPVHIERVLDRWLLPQGAHT